MTAIPLKPCIINTYIDNLQNPGGPGNKSARMCKVARHYGLVEIFVIFAHGLGETFIRVIIQKVEHVAYIVTMQ